MNAVRRPGSALPVKVHPIATQKSKLHARTVSFDAGALDAEALAAIKQHTSSQPSLLRPRSLSNAAQPLPQSPPLPLTTYTSPPHKNRLSLSGVSTAPQQLSVSSPKSAGSAGVGGGGGTPKTNRTTSMTGGTEAGSEFDFTQSKIADRYHKKFKAPLVPDQAILKNDVRLILWPALHMCMCMCVDLQRNGWVLHRRRWMKRTARFRSLPFRCKRPKTGRRYVSPAAPNSTCKQMSDKALSCMG
jgi:hypothetical protein